MKKFYSIVKKTGLKSIIYIVAGIISFIWLPGGVFISGGFLGAFVQLNYDTIISHLNE